ncbi:right-handed parallel beta-helix repeat-containing protein [Salinispora fenicalii]|uniref:right-handed parallel beta-helix repeat-containing protein n=1 Tax=Salinispora fenicalii TaxID=1137263 RepID=UPI00053580B2|nr:right-handed parallel beta-helix repeat-containing protein [Salinispora fenicalii]
MGLAQAPGALTRAALSGSDGSNTSGKGGPEQHRNSSANGDGGGEMSTAGNPGWKGDGHGDGKDKGTPVPCDPNALIAAITAANQAGGGTLRLAEKCTYTLTINQDDNGLPQVFQPITIYGQGATIIRAAAADDFRIFEVITGGDLTLKDLTVAGGQIADADGAGIAAGEGTRLTLERVTVRDNIATGAGSEGGGIYSDRSKVTITKSTITRNTAEDGGGLFNDNAVVLISKSKVTHNTASDEGGGLANNDGNATIDHVVISDNTAVDGGGMHSDGDLTEITKSTITRNTASGLGGGIYDDGDESLLLQHVKVAENTATSGGGLYLVEDIGATIEDSKIVYNTATTGDGGGIAIVGVEDGDPVVALRRTTVSGNQAGGAAGGIFFSPFDETRVLTLTDVRVTDNIAQNEPGGVYNGGVINVFGTITIINNRPTNCIGSPGSVPTCFG